MQPAARHQTTHAAPPDWITADPALAGLRPGIVSTLRAIAAACWRDPTDGHLVGAEGGDPLYRAAGISRSTFFRHLRVLEALGYVVCLSTGGVVNGRQYGNIYGIPARRGSLTPRACARRWQRMVQHLDGHWRPETIRPGEQPTLFPLGDPVHTPDTKAAEITEDNSQPCQSDTPPVSARHGPRVSVTRPPCHTDTHHPMMGDHGMVNDHAHGVQKPVSCGGVAGGFRDIRDTELDSIPRLLVRFGEACEVGYMGGSDADRLRFCALAHYARRRGDRPAAMFAAMVRRAQWDRVAAVDEDWARATLARHEHGQRPARTAGPEVVTGATGRPVRLKPLDPAAHPGDYA